MRYTDPRVTRILGLSAQGAIDAGLRPEVPTISDWKAFFDAAISVGDIDLVRWALKGSLLFQLREFRTYPYIFGRAFCLADSSECNWRDWAEFVWRWCHIPGQTSQSIKEAQFDFAAIWERERFPLDEHMLVLYVYWRQAIFSDPELDEHLSAKLELTRWLPGERQLFHKRVDRLFAVLFWEARRYECEGHINLEPVAAGLLSQVTWSKAGYRLTAIDILRNDIQAILQAHFNAELAFRATLLRMALRAYQLDHGRLPLRLQELSPEYLPGIPRVPGRGEEFAYYPVGLQPPKLRDVSTGQAFFAVPARERHLLPGRPDERAPYFEPGGRCRLLMLVEKPLVWSLAPPEGAQPAVSVIPGRGASLDH